MFKKGSPISCLKVTLVLLIEETREVVNRSLFRSQRGDSGASDSLFRQTKALNIQYKIIGNITLIKNKEVNEYLNNTVLAYAWLFGVNSTNQPELLH